MKTRDNDIPLAPGHLEDDRLIAFLDGETETEEIKTTRAHLESCWDCRSRLSAVERSIENFLQFRKEELLPKELPPAGPALDLFKQRLAARQAITPSQAFFKVRLFGLRRWSRRIVKALNVADYSPVSQILITRAAAAILTVSVIAGSILLWGRFNTVSASELLRLTIAAQDQRLAATHQPVIHQRIQVRRLNKNSKPVTWDIWDDTVNSRVKLTTLPEPRTADSAAPSAVTNEALKSHAHAVQGVSASSADGVASDLRSILAANRMNECRPLSAASYKSWTDSISQKSEEVTGGVDASRDETLTIKTIAPNSTGDGQIAEARFTVRLPDYHPTELYIKVKDVDSYLEFELAEQDFQVVNLKDVDPSVFAGPTEFEIASAVETARKAPQEPAHASVSEPGAVEAVGNANAATASDEVEALDLLHRAGADISEQIGVTRAADGRLLVEGLVETDARKKEILSALAPVANNPAIRIKIQTIEEAIRALQRQKQRSQPVAVDLVEVEKGALPVDADLRAYFGNKGDATDEQIRRFATRAIGHSQSALFQASALNRMAKRFSAADLANLKPEDRAKWLDILKGYAAAVLRETSSLRAELQPVFGGFESGGGAGVISAASLTASAKQLYDLTAANDRIIRSAFTLSSGVSSATAIKTAQFRQSLGSAEALAAAIAQAK